MGLGALQRELSTVKCKDALTVDDLHTNEAFESADITATVIKVIDNITM